VDLNHRILGGIGIPLYPCIDLYLYLAILQQIQIHCIPLFLCPTVSSCICVYLAASN